MLNQITPIILTFDEEPNLHRTLGALTWANEVIVVDSYSSDKSLEICTQYPNVRVVQHAFSSHAQQSNFALAQVSKTSWVLSMDADYIVTPELKEELTRLQTQENVNGYQISFRYAMRGKILNGSLYPPRTCLYRKDAAYYEQDGHTQRVRVKGEIGTVNAKLLHDDRKPYSRWFSSQKKYASQEAEKMSKTPWHELSWADRIRFVGLAPLIILPYTLFVKGLIRNGFAGLEYSFQRFIAELYLIRARLIK